MIILIMLGAITLIVAIGLPCDVGSEYSRAN